MFCVVLVCFRYIDALQCVCVAVGVCGYICAVFFKPMPYFDETYD